jgi:Icc-related predicted phosphoesterase
VQCIFVSDIHGGTSRYDTLMAIVKREQPDGVFIGGDLLPGGFGLTGDVEVFFEHVLFSRIRDLRKKEVNTRFFVILGNDDPRSFEPIFIKASEEGLIDYVHDKTVLLGEVSVTGYAYVPPTPFQLKDWEKFDVSQYVDIGGVSPLEGVRSVEVSQDRVRFGTIAGDLKRLAQGIDMDRAIFLFHSPPYHSLLDRAALDGKKIDHVAVDVHVGSIAIQRFIKKRQPLVTLHGHVHESMHLSGGWHEVFGRTHAMSAAHDGAELAVVRFDTDDLDSASRELV